jgi:hypothetical protein
MPGAHAIVALAEGLDGAIERIAVLEAKVNELIDLVNAMASFMKQL